MNNSNNRNTSKPSVVTGNSSGTSIAMVPPLPTTSATSLVSMLSHLLRASSIWQTTAMPSSATHLHRSAVGSAIDPAVLPLISNGTCYQANNMELGDRFIPCGNVLFGDHSCCQAGDICLEFSACYNSALDMTYVAGCTDREYANTALCPSKGPWKDSAAWLGVAYVGNDTWAACPPGNSPEEYLQKETTVACDYKKAELGFAVFKAEEILSTVGFLPHTLSSLISTSELAPRSDDISPEDESDDYDDDMTSKDGDINGEEPFHGNPDILITLLLLTLFLFVIPVCTMFWRVFFIGEVFGTPVGRDLRRRPPIHSYVDMEPGRHFSERPAPPRRFSLYSLGSMGSMTSFEGETVTNSPPAGCSPTRPRNVRFADNHEADTMDGSPTQESTFGASLGSCPSTKKLAKSETSRTFTWKGLCRKPEATAASLPL